MNLVNERVEHSLFGTGKIINQETDRLSVQFSEAYGTKCFLYPDAFEKYLKICNSELGMAISEELRLKNIQIEAEKARKQQRYEEEEARREMEKAELAALKRKSTRKAKLPKA